MKRVIEYVYPLAVLFFIGLIVFWPSFNLGVFGDNWQIFWNGRENFGTHWLWTSINTYLNPYGGSHLLLYFLGKTFGYNSNAIYILSFIFRTLAAYTLYFFLRRFNLGRIASIAGATIFMVSPVGIEITDWAFQMVSYISISFLLIALTMHLNLSSYKKVLFSLLFYFLAVAINPIRAPGILLTFLTLTLFSFLLNQKNKRYVFYLAILSLVIFFVMGKFLVFGDPVSTRSELEPGLLILQQSLNSHDPRVLLSLLSSVGNTFIPDNITNNYQSFIINIFGGVQSRIAILSLTLLINLVLFLWKRYLFTNKTSIQLFLIWLIIQTLISFFLFKIYNNGMGTMISTIAGFQFSAGILLMSLVEVRFKHYKEAYLSLLVLALSLLFIIFPWIYQPSSSLVSSHRYLIYSALVVPIMVSQSTIYNKGRFNYVGIIFPLTVILIFSFISYNQISMMNYRHNSRFENEVWQNLNPYLSKIRFDKKTIFYFISDNPARLADSVTFNFNFHVGILYNISDLNNTPLVVGSIEDLKSMVSDGKASKKYLGEEYVYPVDNVYILKIAGTKVERINTALLLKI